jgi:hypothetical protein
MLSCLLGLAISIVLIRQSAVNMHQLDNNAAYRRAIQPQLDTAHRAVADCFQRSKEFRESNPGNLTDDQQAQYLKLSQDTSAALKEETRLLGLVRSAKPAGISLGLLGFFFAALVLNADTDSRTALGM